MASQADATTILSLLKCKDPKARAGAWPVSPARVQLSAAKSAKTADNSTKQYQPDDVLVQAPVPNLLRDLQDPQDRQIIEYARQ